MNNIRIASLLAIFLMPAASAVAQTVINVPPDAAPAEIASNTTLNLLDGGTLPEQFNAGVNPENNSNVAVNISGGAVGAGFRANGGSLIEISGGVVGNNFFARGGSVVNVVGGVMDGLVTVRGGGDFSIRGGTFADGFSADLDSAVRLFGGDFRLDGQEIAGLDETGDSVPLDIFDNAVLSGVLADGTPFAMTQADSDVFQIGTLTLHQVDLPAIGPAQITASTDPVPLGVRNGQTLTVDAGGVVGDHFNGGVGSTLVVDQGDVGNNLETFGAVTLNSGSIGNRFDAHRGSDVQINGGSVGTFARAYADSVVTISGGTTGSFFEALNGSMVNVAGGALGSQSEANNGATVNVTDGVVARQFDANAGSVVNLAGGRLAQDFDANTGSTINVTGGIVDRNFEAFENSTVNISGGVVRDAFQALGGSNINIIGSEFLIDGGSIAGLGGGEPFELTDRDVTLSGFLEDGSAFDFVLNSELLAGEDFFDSQANVFLHLLANADFDFSTLVDGVDLSIWEDSFSLDDEADANFDGVSDGADFLEWQRQFGSTKPAHGAVAAVPEPATALLLLIALAAGLIFHCRAARCS